MSCSARRRSWARWRWRRCWPGSRPAATRSGLSRSAAGQLKQSSATSKSAVSRRFVAMTETALAELLSPDLSGLDLVALMIDGVHFAESCCVVALGIDIDGHQASAGAGGGLDGERDAGHRPAGGPAGAGPGRDPPDAGRPRRVQGAAQGRGRRARSPGDPTLPTAQDQKCERPSAATTSEQCRPQDDRRLPRRLGAGGRSRAAGPGQRTRPHPPRRGGQPARGPATRRSRCCAWACRPPWPARCARRTASSR